MALLLDLGLRVGEVVLLEVADFNLKENILHFDRPKVGIDQTHTLPADLKAAVAAWLSSGDCAPFGPVLRGSGKGGCLTESGMSEQVITTRVMTLGKAIGVIGLSAHDCRNYWATRAAKRGTDAFVLRDAGGWTSLDMLNRYVEAGTIANERMKL